MTSRWTKLNVFAAIFCAGCVALSLSPDIVYADDFGRIVHHIEASYHVHRDHRFVMGFAGLVVKVWHVGGVKEFKGAIFEDQHLDGTDADTRLDEIISRAGGSGWQPIVRSFSRHSGEHTYIYAQDAEKDLKLLIVNVEPHEAAVIQVKVDPDKLEQFIEENGRGSGRHKHSTVDGTMSFF